MFGVCVSVVCVGSEWEGRLGVEGGGEEQWVRMCVYC